MPGISVDKRASFGPGSLSLRCFALGDNHLNASVLKDLGVWLGDYDNDQLSVHGNPWVVVKKSYAERTNAGAEQDKLKRLHINKDCNLEEPKAMECAGCKSDRRSTSQPLTLEHVKFTHIDEDVDMRRTVCNVSVTNLAGTKLTYSGPHLPLLPQWAESLRHCQVRKPQAARLQCGNVVVLESPRRVHVRLLSCDNPEGGTRSRYC